MSFPHIFRRLMGTTIGASLSLLPVVVNRFQYRSRCDGRNESNISDETLNSSNSIFQFNLIDIHGKPVNKTTLKDKQAFLIVNVACA